MRISVVIPARNEAKNIGRTLQALAAQSLSKEDFEVLVLDNQSSDNTMLVADTYSSQLTLKVVSSFGKSIASVRNEGATIASGEVLAFLDADCTVPPTWLEDALRLRPSKSIWGAHYIVSERATWVSRVWEEWQARTENGSTNFLPSGSFFVGRKDFDNLGGFAASQQTSEDVDFCMRARSSGLAIFAIPVLAVVHEETPSTLSQFFRQNYWHGRNVMRMFLRNLPSTRSFPVVLLSLYTLAMLVAFPITVAIALYQQHLLWIVAAFVLLLLPAILLSLRKTLAAKRPDAAPALALLYMTYLIARALALVFPAPRTHR